MLHKQNHILTNSQYMNYTLQQKAHGALCTSNINIKHYRSTQDIQYSIGHSKLTSVRLCRARPIRQYTSHVLHCYLAQTLNRTYPSRRICRFSLRCICYKYKQGAQ